MFGVKDSNECFFYSFPFLQVQTCFLLGSHSNRHFEHFLFLTVLILLSQFLFLRAVWGFSRLCWEFKRVILVQTCFLLRRPGIIIIILSQFLFHYAVWGFHCLVLNIQMSACVILVFPFCKFKPASFPELASSFWANISSCLPPVGWLLSQILICVFIAFCFCRFKPAFPSRAVSIFNISSSTSFSSSSRTNFSSCVPPGGWLLKDFN